jgi:hypothetical protein
MKHKKVHEERGQSLIIVAFGIITLLGFIGLAVDLGLSFVERIRLRRAADAAALASASELPLEQAAHIRAVSFLEDNGYGCGLVVGNAAANYNCTDTDDVRLEVNVGAADQTVLGAAEEEADYIIRINTDDYRDEGRMESADRIRVEIVSRVPLFFMRLLGFDDVTISGAAVAENINHLDVALVFDRSGSMEFDTLCFGCWSPDNDESYPDGDRYPLPWDPNDNGQPDHCEGNGPMERGGYDYFVIEAEEYDAISVPYNRDVYNMGHTFWVIQRNGGYGSDVTSRVDDYLRNGNGAGSYGRDVLGGYISHRPGRTMLGAGNDGTGVACRWSDVSNDQMCNRHAEVQALGGPFPAPRADYTFEVTGGTWYFWIRGSGGDNAGPDNNGRRIFWGLDGAVIGEAQVDERSSWEDAARSDRWDWEPLGNGQSNDGSYGFTLSSGTHTLHFWPGAPGFNLDRIIITDEPFTGDAEDDPEDDHRDGWPPEEVRETTSHFDNNRGGAACDPCDARFGGSPTPDSGRPTCTAAMAPQPNRLADDIYDDEQPIRSSIEASKNFIRRLDPRFDQIGYVAYSSGADIESELECVRRRGVENCDMSDFENEVIDELNRTTAGGSTNIADGIRQGIQVLSNRPGHYGRPSAAHIMIVMTDGQANQCVSDSGNVDGNCNDNIVCLQEDYWPDNSSSEEYNNAKDCAYYYALQARNNGIVIYTITIGTNADIELMEGIAEVTGGIHRNAPRPEQLDPIFDELYRRIFLRLVE